MASREDYEYSSQAPAPYIGGFLQKGIFPYASQFLKQQFDQYGQADSSPFTYTGQRVADFDPREQYGMQLQDAAIGSYRPYLGAQAGLLGEAARTTRGGMGQFDPSKIGGFYDPYEEQVVQQTLKDAREGLAKGDIALRDKAISGGAFGGSRSRLQQQDLASDISRGATEAIGGIRSAGYQGARQAAQQAYEAQQNRRMGGAGALAGYGGAYGGMAQGLQGLQGQDISNIMGMGGLGRGRSQSLMDLNYQNFTGQYNLPMQTLQNVGSLTAGLGPLAGGYGYAGATPASNTSYTPAGGSLPGYGASTTTGIPGIYNNTSGGFGGPAGGFGTGNPASNPMGQGQQQGRPRYAGATGQPQGQGYQGRYPTAGNDVITPNFDPNIMTPTQPSRQLGVPAPEGPPRWSEAPVAPIAGAQGTSTPIAGAQGLQGTQGLAGTAGATGAQGLQGTAGLQGAQGFAGAAGAQGGRGERGYTGATGLAGAAGAQGAQGFAGARGLQGTMGLTGTQGLQGTAGATGAAGTQGLQGTAGTTGARGLTGMRGFQGLAGTQGQQGLAGAAGTQGLQGFQGLAGAAGAQGLQGQQGLAGAAGAQGFQGLQGLQGLQGQQGLAGALGQQGLQGLQGAMGQQGLAGALGQQGLQGLQGFQGQQGLAGAMGAQGLQGLQGLSGAMGQQGLAGAMGAQGMRGLAGASFDPTALRARMSALENQNKQYQQYQQGKGNAAPNFDPNIMTPPPGANIYG